MNKDLPIFIAGDDQEFHNIIVGHSGKGRSTLIQQMADQQSMTYKKMERRCQPTEAQIQHRKQEEKASQLASQKRLQMIRDAYWNGSDESEFYDLHDTIVDFLNIAPTKEQVRAVFNLLPSSIIGGAIQWGMDDTEVRDQTYVYIQDNKQLIRKELGLQE